MLRGLNFISIVFLCKQCSLPKMPIYVASRLGQGQIGSSPLNNFSSICHIIYTEPSELDWLQVYDMAH